mmetsp:Transcript_11719/g.28884  ORF Transcript_11719/g.28884 Transcript_11719/m.28884 type:complete len:502 (+) Transcript_11719:281-1786(+)|eukprot:CAMPEP_0114491116 /NCGR_PEP_ID=MMETSP0109-20121206/2823_1 /TAXON_ID=29199 /ORGANISM="Chlorarachnion reptans, Strain CCCM449" /LENGTH=501 /DNA_ID=CAMNT_0001667817 /DNA_START=195 /DNA_END=1700 /DNA_ORIENTATION=-
MSVAGGASVAGETVGGNSEKQALGEGFNAEAKDARISARRSSETRERTRKALKKTKDLHAYIFEMEDKYTKEIGKLKREVRRKTQEIDRLNNRLRELLDGKRQTKQQHALDVAKAAAAARKESDQKNIDMRKENSRIKKEMGGLRKVVEEKERLAAKLHESKVDMKLLKSRHVEEVRGMERNFVQIRDRMQKEMESRVKQFKTECRGIVMKEVEIELTRLRMLNRQMSDEIRFHVKGNNDLRAQNEKMKQRIKQFKLDVELATQKDDMNAARGAKHVDKIRRLKNSNEELEGKVLGLKQEVAKLKRELLEEKARNDHNDQIESLKHHLTLRTNEVHRIKKLAKKILDQRGDVERFFLTSLEQVKHEIRQKKERESKQQKKEYTRQLLSLTKGGKTAPLRGKKNQKGAPAPVRRVDLADLTPEDKERVLRLLFSKINTAAKEPPAPQVGLYNDLDPGSGLSSKQGTPREKNPTDNTFLTNFEAEDNRGAEDLSKSMDDELNI